MDERGESWESFWRGCDLFAFVESREDISDEAGVVGSAWVLDIVRVQDLEHLLDGRPGSRREIPFVATAQVGLARCGIPSRDLDLLVEGTWHGARLGVKEDHLATVFRDLDGAEQWASRLSVMPLHDHQARAVENLVSLDNVPEATEDDLKPLAFSCRSVAVLNVGQGNCNALRDERGWPTVYYDLGAGVLWNSHTRPPDLRFCFSQEPPVFLSHWDFDHWYGAMLPSMPDNSRSGMWFAPRQKVGARTIKFAASLRALRLWPASIPHHDFGPFTVVKCAGTTKNDSGLACFVKTYGGNVLCPGDAEFSSFVVPPGFRAPLAGVVAPHHGSPKSIGTPVPRPAQDAVLAFSFGVNNSYRHPGTSPSLYRAEKWVKQCDTRGGTIELGGRPLGAPCGTSCSLGSSQP